MRERLIKLCQAESGPSVTLGDPEEPFPEEDDPDPGEPYPDDEPALPEPDESEVPLPTGPQASARVC